MKSITLAVLTLTMSSTALAAPQAEGPIPRSASRAGIGRLVPEITVTDVDGDPVDLAPVGDERATVIALTSTTCPLSLKFAPLLGRLSTADAARGVRWIFVDAPGSDTEVFSSGDQLARFASEHGFTGTVVHDPKLALTWALSCSSSAESVVVDRQGTIRYRGCVDDRYGLGYARDEPRITPLQDALTAVLADREVLVPAMTAPGCEVAPGQGRPSEDTPTYHGTISRIMQANCIQCHRTGGAGPFELDTADAVLANATMIKRVVNRGTMPPWFATTPDEEDHAGFVNDARLLPSDVEALTRWVDEGRPLGEPSDAPLPRELTW